MFKKIVVLSVVFASVNAYAGNKVKFYFNRPVDVSVSNTINAIYLNNCMADTLVAYINRAKYTIDIAQYDYNQSNSFVNIATAINSAHARGVQVRWIYDGSQSNTGLALLDTAVRTLGSPTSSHYGIMHNKFVLIDANSADANDPTVWTGSSDWGVTQFNSSANNTIIIQDASLALAYTAEFNMMWGSTGSLPDASLSKFGPDKTDLGSHAFTIEGAQIELYFSPSDGTNTHIQSAISSANTDMYFGMYTFTDNSDASLIASKYNSGVYVAGIDDSYSNSYGPYTTFTNNLGSNFKVYTESGSVIYHNKFLIVDPSDKCSDPLVLTGSHNWTQSANTVNDENTLIIHNDTAANVYLQSFRANFASLGGSLSIITGCPTSVPVYTAAQDNAVIYPNPTSGVITINYTLQDAQAVSVDIYNVTGQKIISLSDNATLQIVGSHELSCTLKNAGMYFVQFAIGTAHFTRKFFVTGN
jgi:phosphatidylserine/phosphatidylglycerophosphate/cardiolipin synthase-like enzyme